MNFRQSPPKTLIEKWIYLIKSENQMFVAITGLFGFVSLGLVIASSFTIYFLVGPKKIRNAKKFLLLWIFIEACSSTLYNSYAVTIAEEPGLIELTAVVDLVNALSTFLLTAFQYADERKKGNYRGGTFVAFVLCGIVAFIRVIIPFVLQYLKLHLYTTNMVTLVSTLSGFIPAFVDLMKEDDTPKSLDEEARAVGITDHQLPRRPHVDENRQPKRRPAAVSRRKTH